MDKYIIMHILMSKQYKKCFEQQTKNETHVDKNNKIITKINSSEKTVKDNTNFLKNIDEDTILLLLSI